MVERIGGIKNGVGRRSGKQKNEKKLGNSLTNRGEGRIVCLTPWRWGPRRHGSWRGCESGARRKGAGVAEGEQSARERLSRGTICISGKGVYDGKGHKQVERSAVRGAEGGEEWGARGRDVCCGELGEEAGGRGSRKSERSWHR